jgi:hypothetical protein
MADLSGMDFEHSHSRDALTGHGRLGARLLLEGSARRSPDGLPFILLKVLRH